VSLVSSSYACTPVQVEYSYATRQVHFTLRGTHISDEPTRDADYPAHDTSTYLFGAMFAAEARPFGETMGRCLSSHPVRRACESPHHPRVAALVRSGTASAIDRRAR
jgi:hypothetical protein